MSPPRTSTTSRSTPYCATLHQLAAPGRVVVVATHDERLLPPADRILQLSPRACQAATAPVTRSLQAHQVVFEQGDAGDLVLCR